MELPLLAKIVISGLIVIVGVALLARKILGKVPTIPTNDRPEFADDLESYLMSRSEAVYDRFFADGYDSLNAEDKVFVAIWSLDGQVNNGGFDQYFFNETGELWKETLWALEAIGSEHITGLFKQAIAVFPGSGPALDDEERREQVLAFGERESEILAELDSSYYQTSEYLMGLLHAYLMKQ